MFAQLAKFGRRHEYVTAGLALAGVVLIAYGVIFMGYTFSLASPAAGVLPSGPYGYMGRKLATPPIIDVVASVSQTLPMHKLVAEYILSGIIPLWNPYQAAGTPLAADFSQASVYAPVTILHVLPVQLWDILILLRFWIAGISTYAFVRVKRLSRESAFVGSVLFMLSGAFVWQSSMDHLNVIMLTPLVLLAVERVIVEKRNSIVVAGLVIMLSILGAHVESLILQFLLVLLYFIFRTVTSSLRVLLRQCLRFISSCALGLGLSAFFVGPTIEYLLNASASHVPGEGLGCVWTCLSPYLPITTFVPYFFGQVQSYAGPYWDLVGGWDALGGYVGVSALYLALIGVASVKSVSPREKEERRFAIFFLVIAVLALLKSYGVPPVQWIGYLPILDLIAFGRYLDFVWAFSFSMAAAVGFEKLTRIKISRMALLFAFALSSLTLLSLASFSVPTPLSPGSIPFYYAGANLTESFLFLAALALLSLRLLSNKALKFPLICMIVLEMAVEIPLGLSYFWQAVRESVIVVSLIVIIIVAWRTLPFKSSGTLRVCTFPPRTLVGLLR